MVNSVVPLVASQLARHPETGISEEDLRLFFAKSLGGNQLACRVTESLTWLADPSRLLAFRTEEGRYQSTTLGLLTNRSTLPVEMASAAGQTHSRSAPVGSSRFVSLPMDAATSHSLC